MNNLNTSFYNFVNEKWNMFKNSEELINSIDDKLDDVEKKLRLVSLVSKGYDGTMNFEKFCNSIKSALKVFELLYKRKVNDNAVIVKLGVLRDLMLNITGVKGHFMPDDWREVVNRYNDIAIKMGQNKVIGIR